MVQVSTGAGRPRVRSCVALTLALALALVQRTASEQDTVSSGRVTACACPVFIFKFPIYWPQASASVVV